jgi:uncharacterized protein (DUF924 family)
VPNHQVWADAVNRFWFEELKPEDWFAVRPALDEEILHRFGPIREDLKRHPPAPATLDAGGLLAAVIVLDQFSRNIFRGSAEAFATDDLALSLAEYGIETGLDQPMPPNWRMFLYMPFMHSENATTQRRSVEIFGGLGIADQLKYAEHHKGIIDRFGRFPARNTALGRDSTPEELLFVEEDRAF